MPNAPRSTERTKPHRSIATPAPGEPRDARNHLIRDACDGGITLVVGAGVSLGHGLPSWATLAERLWREAFPRAPVPSDETLPQLWPFAFEHIEAKMGRAVFADRLRAALYEEARFPKRRALAKEHGSLASVARAIVDQFRIGAERSLARVITFNVDDLLERAAFELHQDEARPAFKPIVRASYHPRYERGYRPIPIYHLHGYLPSDVSSPWRSEAPDTLVFTDLQYWASAAAPGWYPNRVMSFALHDSHCVFVGISMRDVNVLRWLALRAHEVRADRTAQFSGAEADPIDRAVRRTLRRHYWIRPDSDDPSGFLTRSLALRGVRPVRVPTWDSCALQDVLDECFESTSTPPPKGARRSSSSRTSTK